MMTYVNRKLLPQTLAILCSGVTALTVTPPALTAETQGFQAQEGFSSATALMEIPPLGEANSYLPEETKLHIVLRLGERRVYLYRGDEALKSYPVAIGKASTPTPTGTYEVFQLIENPVWQSPWTGEVTEPGPNSALGLRWIGFAQMSNGVIGFHGTPTVSSIGKAASNGCVRMYNKDVVELFSYLEMGTTVIVEK